MIADNENKEKIVSLRFRESELRDLDRRAEEANLSRTAYITRKVQGLPVKSAPAPAVNWKTYGELATVATELSAIGNNINQIARVLNRAEAAGQPLPRSLPSVDRLMDAVESIERLKPLLKQVRLELAGVNPSCLESGEEERD